MVVGRRGSHIFWNLDTRLTDGGEVVSPARRSLFMSQENSWYSFMLGG
jgi:hypothetical protein